LATIGRLLPLIARNKVSGYIAKVMLYTVHCMRSKLEVFRKVNKANAEPGARCVVGHCDLGAVEASRRLSILPSLIQRCTTFSSFDEVVPHIPQRCSTEQIPRMFSSHCLKGVRSYDAA
jgi:hypothetical protein